MLKTFCLAHFLQVLKIAKSTGPQKDGMRKPHEKEILQRVRSELLLSEPVTAQKLLSFVHREYRYLGLSRFDEEMRADFLVHLYPILERVASRYKATYMPLNEYLRFIVHLQMQTYLKNYVARTYKEEAFLENYVAEAKDMFLQDQCQTYSGYNAHKSNFAEDFAEEFTEDDAPKRQFTRYEKEAILLLALRSSHYLSEWHIKKVANATGLQEATIAEYVHTLNETTKCKQERTENLKKRVHYLYYMICQYERELQTLDKESFRFLHVTKKLDYTYQKWKECIERLRSREVSVSIRAIGSVLDASPQTLARRLKRILERECISAKPRKNASKNACKD